MDLMTPTDRSADGPLLSVLVPALRGEHEVAAALAAWDAQTRRAELEVLVLCPDRVAAEDDRVHAPTRRIDSSGLGLHEVRARGIRAARGAFVLIGEDHCLPDPEAAAALLDAAAAGWDVVVPALRPADPRTAVACAAFLLGYGQWMEPTPSGPCRVFPGHNSVVRRSLLLERGERLADDLRGAAFLTRVLAEAGARGTFAPQARLRHFDSPSWRFQLKVFASVGIGFGALRTRSWPRGLRLLTPLAAPAIALRHAARAARHLRRRASPPRGTGAAIALLAGLWGVCEGLGALAGVERGTRALMIAELKPVTAADVARAAEAERTSA
jgi:hypothetical protein